MRYISEQRVILVVAQDDGGVLAVIESDSDLSILGCHITLTWPELGACYAPIVPDPQPTD